MSTVRSKSGLKKKTNNRRKELLVTNLYFSTKHIIAIILVSYIYECTLKLLLITFANIKDHLVLYFNILTVFNYAIFFFFFFFNYF